MRLVSQVGRAYRIRCFQFRLEVAFRTAICPLQRPPALPARGPLANEQVSHTATTMSTSVVTLASASGVNNSTNGATSANKPRPTRCDSG